MSNLNHVKVRINDLLAKPKVRAGYETAQLKLSQASSSSRMASHVFHTVAPVRFSREQLAVVAGQRAYYEQLKTARDSAPALRRNIHRLEKGLLMRPQRPVFALDYIGETLEFFAIALSGLGSMEGEIDRDEILWANDVLAAYFDRTDGQSAVVGYREEFERVRASGAAAPLWENDRDEASRIPYKRGDETPPVKFEDFLALTKRRRSIRWFRSQPVERELIDKALMAARQAPTACNRMPYEFLVFDEPELATEIAGIPFGTGGYAENIPVTVVLVGQLDNYFSPRDRHAIYVDTSLAAMSFMFALETLGLSSCAINWPDFEPLERKLAKRLGLETHERPIMLMAVGYADPEGEVAYSQKKGLDTFRHYNRIRSDRSE